jgi:hypothetical protein
MRFRSLRQLLGASVSGESLAIFRILLGTLMVLEAVTLCVPMPDMVSTGRTPLEAYFTSPQIHFHTPFAPFFWVPLPGPAGMHWLVGALGGFGVLMALGCFYRVTSVMTFLLWTWLYVGESLRTYWRSDYYLDLLLLFLLLWMPAARCFSVDAVLARHRARRAGPAAPGDSLSPGMIPFWPVFLLRAQLVIAYFFAGFTKLSADWLLDAAPVRWFLQRPNVTEPFRHALTASQFHAFEPLVHSTPFAFFISWVGMLFDLAVGFLLLGRRTRMLGLVLMTLFHTTNHFVIFNDIAWFPLVGITTSWIFLGPDWPSTLKRWIRSPHFRGPDLKWFIPGVLLLPGVGGFLGWKVRASIRTLSEGMASSRVLVLVLAWMGFQIVFPLRCHLIAGDERFTWEGLSFAWRLKADTRHAYVPTMTVEDPAVIERKPGSQPVIHWDHWKDGARLHRIVDPKRLDWSSQSELIVVREDTTGERVLFNPLSSAFHGTTREAAVQRARVLWISLHGHPPEELFFSVSLNDFFPRLTSGLRDAGETDLAQRVARLEERLRARSFSGPGPVQDSALFSDLGAALDSLHRADPGGSLIPYFQRLPPFIIESEGRTPPAFLVIKDSAVLKESPTNRTTRVKLSAWKGVNGQTIAESGTPLEVLTTGIDSLEPGEDSSARIVLLEDGQPIIQWDFASDLSTSQLLHFSSQPFYLRRYTIRVADFWQAKTGRRPQIRVRTWVSYNGRPYQPIVDPTVDLAATPLHWFSHNPWITDLQTPRIPSSALQPGRNPPSVF